MSSPVIAEFGSALVELPARWAKRAKRQERGTKAASGRLTATQDSSANREVVVVKLRRRFLVLATVLATVVAMVGVSAPVAAASGTTSDIHVIWKLVGGTVAMK